VNKPAICLSITDNNPAAIRAAEKDVDFLEVRLDIIGDDWRNLVKVLTKPWIACNRSRGEGGMGDVDAGKRLQTLLEAGKEGAAIIDIEYFTPGLPEKINLVKNSSKCLLSFHDLESTPPLGRLVEIINGQIKAGADICKVVTTATKFEDNLTLLKLLSEFPQTNIAAFAMGKFGRLSRVISPLCGGYFTYCCLEQGLESAAGQISLKDMKQIYGCLRIS
jgi:3-dehydroquinate dehydratase-1